MDTLGFLEKKSHFLNRIKSSRIKEKVASELFPKKFKINSLLFAKAFSRELLFQLPSF